VTDKPTDAPADRLVLLLDLAAVALRNGDDEVAMLLLTEADLTARQLLTDPNVMRIAGDRHG
jgi:hypothetical protein